MALALAIAALAAAGCGDESSDGGGSADESAAGNPYIVEMLQDGMREVAAERRRGKSPHVSCIPPLQYARRLKDATEPEVERLVSDARRTCGYEAPIEYVEATLDEIEAASKGDDPGASISECVDVDQNLARLFEEHADDARVEAAQRRHNRACPYGN